METTGLEGPWKSFTLRTVQPQDEPKIRQHLEKCYNRDEPGRKFAFQAYCSENNDLTYEELNSYFSTRILAKIQKVESQGLSLMAIDNETQELVGLNLAYHYNKEVEIEGTAPSPIYSPQIEKFRTLLHSLFTKSELLLENVLEIFGVKDAAFNYVLSVDPKYRQQGLAKEMYRRMNMFFKKAGYKLTLSVFTSPWSIKAAEANGFYELDPENRLYMASKLPNADPEYYVTLMVCKL